MAEFLAPVVPGMTPYVMLNYTGEARDIATMAHELGHAWLDWQHRYMDDGKAST